MRAPEPTPTVKGQNHIGGHLITPSPTPRTSNCGLKIRGMSAAASAASKIEDEEEGDETGPASYWSPDWLRGMTSAMNGELGVLEEVLGKHYGASDSINVLRSQLRHLGRAFTAQLRDRETFRDRIRDGESRRDSDRREIESLRISVNKAKEERERATHRIENISSDVKRSDTKIKELIAQTAGLERENASLKDAAEKRKKAFAELKKDGVQAKKDAEELRKSNEQLGHNLQELRDQYETLKEQENALRLVLQEKDSEIDILKATPLSSNHESQGGLSGHDGLPSPDPVDGLPPPFIKQEAPDPEAAVVESMPTGWVAAESTAETVENCMRCFANIGSGLTAVLGKMFEMDGISGPTNDSVQGNEVVVSFISNIGALYTDPCTADSHANGFWRICQPWAPSLSTGIQPRSSVAERFLQLCFLIPPLREEHGEGHADLLPTVINLVTSLMEADHSESPSAGQAFLETMATLRPPAQPGVLMERKVVSAMIICELCRFLEQTFPDIPRREWTISGMLGMGTRDQVDQLSIGKFATTLSFHGWSAVEAFEESLAQTCGEEFCRIPAMPGNGGDPRMGLLYCGDGHMFLLIDFTCRSIRVVERQLAAMKPSTTEAHRFDLVLAQEKQELLRVQAASKDLASFWLKYVLP